MNHTNPNLGQTPTEGHKRDAIHIAVIPVVAGQKLKPGGKVVLKEDGTLRAVSSADSNDSIVGIVDPFRENNVEIGETFWLLLYPQTITSLRHEWTHPAFPEKSDGRNAWIESFAENLDITYDELMAAADQYYSSGDYTNLGDNENYSAHYAEFPRFWKEYGKVRGISVDADKGSFFSCSC